MTAPKKRTGIFGGTFNPVHNGHVAAAKSFLASGLIDELWILLNPDPPHKTSQKFAPYPIRLNMLREAFQSVDNTQISDIETNLPSPNYTLQTLKYLAKTYPARIFFLCIGKDSFLSFKKWHRWGEILTYCDLLVAERPVKEQPGQDPELMKYAQYIDHKSIDISSTEVRNRTEAGKSIKHLVPPGVLEIISEEKLYQ